jgi:hypothetical protein
MFWKKQAANPIFNPAIRGSDIMKSVFRQVAISLCVGLVWVVGAQAQGQEPGKPELSPNHIPHRINPHGASSEAPTAGGTAALTPIINHGGGTMTGAPQIHLIWYGNWAQANGSDTAAGQQLVFDFMYGLNQSLYLSLNADYTGTNTIGMPQQANVGYLSGRKATRLGDADIKTIVSNYVNSHGGAQKDAVYFVLTSSDVNETSGFCTKYCGWHTHASISGVDVKYSFVGNANRCLSGCAAQTVSPNGNAGVDGMISVVAHELVEATSDPDLNAWYDANGAENADKCAWTFSSAQKPLPSGAYYNTTLPTSTGGNNNYLVQRNLRTDNKCYIAPGVQ